MFLKIETLNKIHDLAKDKEYSWFFDKLGQKHPIDENLIGILADAFCIELDIKYEKREKIFFALELAFIAGKEKKHEDI